MRKEEILKQIENGERVFTNPYLYNGTIVLYKNKREKKWTVVIDGANKLNGASRYKIPFDELESWIEERVDIFELSDMDEQEKVAEVMIAMSF